MFRRCPRILPSGLGISRRTTLLFWRGRIGPRSNPNGAKNGNQGGMCRLRLSVLCAAAAVWVPVSVRLTSPFWAVYQNGQGGTQHVGYAQEEVAHWQSGGQETMIFFLLRTRGQDQAVLFGCPVIVQTAAEPGADEDPQAHLWRSTVQETPSQRKRSQFGSKAKRRNRAHRRPSVGTSSISTLPSLGQPTWTLGACSRRRRPP